MVLSNVKAFKVLKVLHNPVSMQKIFLKITAEVNKIAKSVQCDLAFIFIELLEAPNSFVNITLVPEIKNVASSTKTRFY